MSAGGAGEGADQQTSRYTADLDLRGVNDAHIQAIGRVPARSRVLDLGLADGSVAALLGEMGCQVWGVELDPEAAAAAKRVCQEVAVEDLNSCDLADRFAGLRFDVVLMLDVLEHLSDPATVLRGVGAVLDEGGWGVISLPNVAHLSLRLSLLEGRFTYTDVGLLDRTHLRFFDRDGVDGLLAEAGWAMFGLSRVTRALGTTEIQLADADPELVARFGDDPEAMTYQFVVCAAPIGSPVLERPPVLPAAVAQDELLRVFGYLDSQLSEIREAGLARRATLHGLLETLRENYHRQRDALAR